MKVVHLKNCCFEVVIQIISIMNRSNELFVLLSDTVLIEILMIINCSI